MGKPDPANLPCGVTGLPGVIDILQCLATDINSASYQADWARDVVEDHGWRAITYLRRLDAYVASARARLDQLQRIGVI